MIPWTPTSWQFKKCSHFPSYPSAPVVEQVLHELAQCPPLVTHTEIEALKMYLGEAIAGRIFILQGGDCAESFTECQAPLIKKKLALLQTLSSLLAEHLGCPVIPVGRIAGQYAKPRSNLMELRQDTTLPSYQGDMINGISFTENDRIPNPNLMQHAYDYSAKTLQVIRADAPSFFTSHEALLLPYEQAFTRYENNQWYNLATHFPWIGYRTNEIDGAHIEYARGIANPIAIKIGPATTPEHLQQLVLKLNPDKSNNRLMIMTRLGADHTQRLLPGLIRAVQQVQVPLLWSCDPMHGNTRLTSARIKTRYMSDIVRELTDTLRVHAECGSHLGAMHLELSPEEVTECIGGNVQETDLATAYTSLVDPRLNAAQAFDVTQQFAREWMSFPVTS